MDRHDSDLAHAWNRHFLSLDVLDEVIDVLVSHRVKSIAQLNELLESILIASGTFVRNQIGKKPKGPTKSEVRKMLSQKSG